MSRATTFATTTTNTERHTAAGETAPAQPSILNTNTPSRSKPSDGTTSGTQPSHRLLYRGALSLSDSLLVLDGLSFTTEIAERGIGSSPSTSLLENPLILALESMRGRNLHLLGTVDLNKVWLDRTRIDISVSIHPYSVLSHIYFDNVLCMDSFTSPDGRTTQGIRVGFTENSDEPESTEFVIYGQLCPSTSSLSSPVKSLPSTSTSEPPQVRMIATRILSSPPPASPATRPPRPDDPTPRKPPAHLLFSKNNPTSGSSSASAKRKREVSSSSALSSSCSSSSLLTFGESSKRVKKELGGKGKGRDYGEDESGSGVVKKSSRGNMSDGFKVPSLPSRSYSQPSFGGSGGKDDVDVFGSIPNGGGGNGRGVMNGLDELEKANKTVIKQATVACLAKHSIPKGHADHYELYQTTYRGVSFALRNIMRTQAVAMRTVDRLVEAHAKMYVYGTGENHTCNNSESKKNTN